jgi:uncharacterized membrane protein (UPF0127 family)
MSSSGAISAFNRTRGTCLAQDVRLARSHWTRLRGLIGTEESAFRSGQALWIVPCRGVHTLAMRFPLDVIYLDRSSRVVRIAENLEPWRFAPVEFSASSVLELPAGTIRRCGTTVGDEIEIVGANPLQDLEQDQEGEKAA